MSGGESSAKKRRLRSLLGAAPVRRSETVSASVIETLPHETLCDILMDAADQHPDVASRIAIERNSIIAAEQAKTGDFHMYLERVWNLLNADYGCKTGLERYEKASEVTSAIQVSIQEMEKAARWSSSSNLLETLVKMGKSICLSYEQTLGDEVIKQFKNSCFLEATMVRVVRVVRVARVITLAHGKSITTKNFGDQLDELRDLSTKCGVFEGFKGTSLSDVRNILFEESSGSDEG